MKPGCKRLKILIMTPAFTVSSVIAINMTPPILVYDMEIALLIKL